MRDSYDFSSGIRGKYVGRYAEGTNVVILDPDVARIFGDQKSVNDTLRAVAHILDVQARRTQPATPRRSPRENTVRRKRRRG